MPISVQPGTTPVEPSAAVSSEAGSLLLIEDNPIDAMRTMALLRTRVPDMSCRHVSTLADATPELLAAADCVLLDLSLPDAKDQEGLKEVLQRATDVPVVVITGKDDPLETGLESLRNGAQDYLTKDTLDANALEQSIRYAIERKGFQAHLTAAAVLSAAAAVMAQGEAASTEASAGAEVQASAARAAAAATDVLRATDLTVANAAVAAADAAALAAVTGAAEVATTSRVAAAAALKAATTAAAALAADAAAAAALAADATASAGAARDAARNLAERIRTEATEVSGLADDVVTAVVTDLVAEAGAILSPVGEDDDDVVDEAGQDASAGAAARPARSRSAHSLAFRVLVLTAKLAVAVVVLLTLLLLLSNNTAS